MNFTWLLGLLFLSQQVKYARQFINHKQWAALLNCYRTDFSMNLPGLPIIHTEKFKKIMDEIDKHVSKEPRNSIMNNDGNIIPGQVGYRLDRQIFTEQVYSYYFSFSCCSLSYHMIKGKNFTWKNNKIINGFCNGSSKLELPLLSIYPRVY